MREAIQVNTNENKADQLTKGNKVEHIPVTVLIAQRVQQQPLMTRPFLCLLDSGATGCWISRDRIPSTTPGAEPPRDARDSGSARSHSTHLETSSSDRPKWSPTRSSTRYQDQISVKCMLRTLRMPSFTRAAHAQPSLSNFPRRDSNFGERTRSRGTTLGEQNFPTSPKIKRPNLHIVRYTCQCEQYQLLTQNERRAHPNWAPTREPKRELLEVYSNPKQDRFQDLLKAICPDI